MQGAVVACLEQDIWFDEISVEKSCVRVALAHFFVRPTIWGSCNTQEWVKSHIWMSHITHMNQSCRTYERIMYHTYESVMPHIWRSHATHIHESRHTYESRVHHSCQICVTWLIYMCDVTHLYVWHDLLYVWHHSFICVIHDSFICVTWLIYRFDMTHSYVWYDSFICLIWLIHMCNMTRPIR